MSATRPQGYSATQIMLHWSVATLVVFQFFINDGIEDAFRGFMRGEGVEAEEMAAANVHIIIGMTILVLALWRITLRFSRGVPPVPGNEPPILRKVAEGTHIALYALIVLTPLSGAAAWFLASEAASAAHGVFRALLFILAVLHIIGALVQVFVFKSDALTRMLMTKD